MPTTQRGRSPQSPISINIAERAYALRLFHADLALAEFRSGIEIMASETFWQLNKASAYKMSLLLWASMLWLRPDLELEEIRQQISMDNIVAVAEAVRAVVERDVKPILDKLKALQSQQEPSDDPFSTTGSASEPLPSSISD